MKLKFVSLYGDAQRELKIAMLRQRPHTVIARKIRHRKQVLQATTLLHMGLCSTLMGYTEEEFRSVHARYVNGGMHVG